MRLFKKIAEGSFIIFISLFIAYALEYVFQVFVGNRLSPEDFGIFSISYSIFWILSTLATAGVTVAITKYTAERKDFLIYLTNGMILQVFIAFGISLIITVVSLLFLTSSKFSNLLVPLILVSFILVPTSISMGVKAVMRGLEKIKELGLLNVIEVVFKVMACVMLINSFKLPGVILSIAVGSIAAILPASAILRYGASEINIQKMKELLIFAIPNTAIAVLFVILVRGDVIILKFLNIASDTEIGLYTGSAVLARTIFYFSAVIPIVIFPMIVKKEDINIKVLLKIFITIFAIIDVFLWIYRVKIVDFFFPENYLPLSYILPYLAIGMSILSIDSILSSIIVAKGFPFASTKALFIGLMVFIVSTVLLLPIYRITSVAIGVASGGLVAFILLSFALKDVLFHEK